MKQLPGFKYDAKRKRVSLDGFVSGTEGKVRRRKTIENVTRDEAVVHWKVFRADLKSGRATRGPVTLRRFLDEFSDRITAAQQESTRATQKTLIENHLLRYFGEKPLTEITSTAVTDFMADMRARKLSPAYINNAVRVLKTILRHAVERDVIADYPIKKKIVREKEKPLRLELTREERERFFAVFDDEDAFRRYLTEKRRVGAVKQSDAFAAPRRFGGGLRGDSAAAGACFARFQELRELFVIAIETGLRKGDLRDLRWVQVDLAAGFIRVLMQKTSLEAEIPISRACRSALLAMETMVGRGEYVFVDRDGRRYSATRIRRGFVLAKKLSGITRRLRPHDLRHTLACRLADTLPLQVIARVLGHTSVRMSERYSRPSEESMRKVVAALDADPL